MLGSSIRTPIVEDEYLFYRLASNFPDYSCTPDWFFEDRPEIFNYNVYWEDAKGKGLFTLAYDTPIFIHTPLPVLLVSPIVKGLNFLADNNIISHIEDQPGIIGISEEQRETSTASEIEALAEENRAKSRAEDITNILRIIPILLCASSLWLMYKTIEHKVGTNIYLFSISIVAGIMLSMGVYLFYWDVFMIFFFALTLYLMEVKPNSKWKYVTACCLVNTKMFLGIAFLAPLVVKAIKDNWRTSWKMMLPVLSIIPFYIATVVVTGDPIYFWTHYVDQIPIHTVIYGEFTLLSYLNTFVGLGLPIILLMTAPIVWCWKKYPEYVLLLVITFVYIWGGGLSTTHTSTMIYVTVLIFPLVAYETKFVERIRNWIKAKQKDKN